MTNPLSVRGWMMLLKYEHAYLLWQVWLVLCMIVLMILNECYHTFLLWEQCVVHPLRFIEWMSCRNVSMLTS